MRPLLFILALLFTHSLFSQIRPDNFPEVANPDSSNFELYSQKGGLSRRANLYSLKEYFTPGINLTPLAENLSDGDTIASNFMSFVEDSEGETFYVSSTGIVKRVSANPASAFNVTDTTTSTSTYSVSFAAAQEVRVVVDLSATGSSATIELPSPDDNIGKRATIKQINPTGGYATQVTVNAIGNRIRLPGNSILTNVLNIPAGSENKYTLTPAYDSNSGVYFWDVDNESISSFSISDNTVSVVDASGTKTIDLSKYRTRNTRAIADAVVSVDSSDVQVNVNYNLPLLDNLTVSPRAAYSLRKISSDAIYSGPALTVENSLGDTLQVNFTGGTHSLIDTTAILAFDDTVYIKRWYDQTGNGFHLVTTGVSITGFGPYIVQNGVITKNSNGDVAARYISTELNALGTSTSPWRGDTSVAFSVATIHERTSGSAGAFGTIQNSATGGSGYLISGGDFLFNTGGYTVAGAEAYVVATDTDVMPLNTTKAGLFIVSPTTSKIYINNAEVAYDSVKLGTADFVNPAQTASYAGFRIGRNGAGSTSFWFFNGYISETVVWDNDPISDLAAINAHHNSLYLNKTFPQTTNNSIVVTVPNPVDSLIYKIVTVNHLGSNLGTTIVKALSASDAFYENGVLKDSLILSSKFDPTITLQALYTIDSTVVWKVVSNTGVDERLLDTIADRADKFIYLTNYASIEEAVDSAVAKDKLLVIDKAYVAADDVDFKGLQVMFTTAGLLTADTIFADSATLINPGPRKIFGATTNVVGTWVGSGPAYIEWTVGTDTSSYANVARAFRNAHIMGDYIKLQSKRYPTSKIDCNSTKPVIIRGDGSDVSIIIIQGTGLNFYSSSTGSNVDIQNVAIETKEHESGTYNTGSNYQFTSVQRSSTYTDAYTDISYFKLDRVKILGEVSFVYSIEGSALTYPDSITFASSGINTVEIANSRFEHVRDVFTTGNSFFRKATVSSIEVYNLYGSFFNQTLTLDDSLSRQGYNNSYLKFTDAYFRNDTIVNYFGGGYMGIATIKGRSAEIENVVVENMIKELGATLYPFGYLSCEFYSIKNSRCINSFDKGEWSPFEFKGARYSEISNCQILISPAILEQYGIINSSGDLISSDYGFSIIDTDDGSVGKSLNMHDCIIDVPIWNVSTGVQDINNFTFRDNVVNINRFTAEPTTTGDNTVPYSIWAEQQTRSNSDTTRAFVSSGNVFSIEDIVGNDNSIFYVYAVTGGSSTVRLYETVLYEDDWTVDTGIIKISLHYTEKWVNRSKFNGVGQLVVVPIPSTIQEGGEVKYCYGDIRVGEHYHVYNPGGSTQASVWPHLKELFVSYTADRNNSDTIVINDSNQNDWFTENIGYPFNHIYQLDYVDTFGIRRYEEFRLTFAGSFNVTGVSSGSSGTFNWGSTVTAFDPVYNSDIRLVAGSDYRLYLTNLANVKSFKLSIKRIDTNSFPRFSGDQSYTTGTGGEVRFYHNTKEQGGSFYGFFQTVDSILVIQIDTITPDSIRATIIGASGPIASGQSFRIRWYYKLVMIPMLFVFVYNEKKRLC